jgi:hypothetical protein
MSNNAQESLTLLALGIRGDQPVDSEQPPLPDGVHLRWFPAEQAFGLPWNGFYLFRRESQPIHSLCLSTQLGKIFPRQSNDLRLPTKLGTLSSTQPLLFTDDFAPSGTIEIDLRAPLRFDLPDGVRAGRVTVRVGFRAGDVTRTCVDFRPFPLGGGANPRTEQGAVFTIEPLLTPPNATASINLSSGSVHGLQGVSRFESSVRITITLPCPATRVDLLVTNPADVKIEGFEGAAATSVGAQNFAALVLQAGAVRLSGKAITRVTLESSGVQSALLHQICWECPKAASAGRSIDANFEEWPVGQWPNSTVQGPNPVVEQGVSFQVLDHDEMGQLRPVPLASFDKRGQAWTGLLGPRIDIQLPCLTTKVTMQFSRTRNVGGVPTDASNDPPVHVQAFNQDGTLAQSLDISTGGATALVLQGAAITRIQVDMPGQDGLLHRIFFDCVAAPTPAPSGPASISVTGLTEIGTEVTGITITGDPGQVVAGTLEPQSSGGLSAITISAAHAALIDICYVPVRQSETFGWQELPKFSYPLCLPVADAGYPCPGKPATTIDAKTLALSRVTYPAPTGWDQGFPALHDELAALVHGGPSGTPMADVEHPTLAGTPLSPSTQSDIPSLPNLKPLDLIFLASLHPAIAQMLGLYFVDQSAVPGFNYDYLLLGDPDGVLGGTAASALDWLAVTHDFTQVWKQSLLNQSTAPHAPIAPPDKPKAYALPGMATRAIDGTLPSQAAGSVGLWWPLPPDPADQQPQPGRIVFYYPKRVFLGAARPADEPDPSQYTTRLPAVLVSEPDPDVPADPIARSSEWPPPSITLHVVDSNLPEGWYSYRLAGQDLFGRRSPLSAPAAWFQWDPQPTTAAPWYYQPTGIKSIDAFAVALLDKIPPPAPLGVEAWALDPDDQWVLADPTYDAWRANNTNLVGLRVRWRWTLMQQIQAPDTREFRLYYQPGRWNALLGNVGTVTAASPLESDVVLDFADARAADAFAGTRLRAGNSDFEVIGSQPGTNLRLRVKNIGANNNVGPAAGKQCTIAIPEQHALWVDTSIAATWAKRLAVVPYEPPARTVVDPSKDAAGLLLRSDVFNAGPAIVISATVTLPSPANLSGVQPWIDHFWLRDANHVEQTHRIVRYDVAARTITLETVPTIAPASWMVGRPAREYDVFLPAPDVGLGLPFEPSLAEPSVYAQIAVSAADDKTHAADTFPGGTLAGNESHLSPSATIYRVRQRLDEVPHLPQLGDRLVATPADYHSRSYTTFRFLPIPHLKIHILRALDDTLFQRDWLIRETRKALDPAKHPDAFPETWNTTRREDAATPLNLITSETAYATLPNDAWDVLSRLPGNERAAGTKPILHNADVQARDWLVRRTHGAIGLTDTALFPTYWTPATRIAALGVVNNLAASADYATLPDNALRLLAALPGNEPAFAQVTIHPFEMSDPEIQDQRRPDDDATYPPNPTLRAYMDTLPGRATNRYFYRASFVDGAQNQGALSLPGPPVYLPKVEPPRAPVITKVVTGQRAITLTWARNREGDFAQYRVYRTRAEDNAQDLRSMDVVATVALTDIDPTKPTVVWTDTLGLVGGQKVFYRLTATDTSGNESLPSRTTPTVVVDTTIPPSPDVDERTWLLQRQADGVLLPWPADGVIPLAFKAVVRLGWRSETLQPQFGIARMSPGERVWSDLSGTLSTSPSQPERYVFLDQDADPTVESSYRLRVRSSSGVWSTEDTIIAVGLPGEAP